MAEAGGGAAAAARRFRWSGAFARLWAAQAASQVGTQVSLLAIPLAGAVTLHATPFQMGLLGLLGRLPFLLYPFAGIWVDRVRRRPVMVAADLLRAVLLLAIPAAAALGRLRMEVLYATMGATILVTVWFDTANRSFLPAIVGREELLDANSRLEATASASRVAGPSLGGLLVQLLTAPFAVLVDALSFVVSAALIGSIHAPEAPAARRRTGVRALGRELAGGFQFVLGHRLLRTLTLAVAASHFFWAVQLAVYFLFLARDVALPSAAIGLVVAAAGPGVLAGSVVARWLPARIGLGPAMIAGWALFGLAALLVPAAAGPAALAALALAASQLLMAAAVQVISVNNTSYRQAITAMDMQGRAMASTAFLGFGVAPLGSLAGGALGGAVGLRATELAAAAGLLAVALALLPTAVRGLRRAAA